MGNYLQPRVRPLALALALSVSSGFSAANVSTPLSTVQAQSLVTASLPTATTLGASGNYVREERSDHGTRTHASRMAPLDENGRARYVIVFKDAPVASYSGLPMMKSIGRANRKDMHSSAAQNYATKLASAQSAFLSAVSATLGRTITANYQYQHALNAVAVDLTPAEAEALRGHAEVLKVNREQVYELKTYNSPTFIGASTIWNGTSTPNGLASKGEGMIIGEIDTGINWTSKSMQATGSDGYTITNPLGTGVYLGNCLATGTIKNGYTSKGYDVGHCNDKLIGIYNTEYTGATSATGYNPISGQDLDGHGTHTASTAGGSIYDSAPYSGGTFKVSGVAPHANVIAYLACGTQTYSCYDLGLAAAVNQAVADGIVDSLNYSIGGPEDSPWSSTIQTAFLGAEDAGIFVAQAAGNDGPGASSIDGNESPWTTTVAATTPAQIPSFSFSLATVAGSSAGLPANTQGLAAIPGSAPVPTQAYTNLPLIQSPNFADGTNDGCAAYPANTFSRGGVGGIAVLRLDQTASACASGTRRTNAAAAGATAVIYVDPYFIGLGATGASYSVLLSAWNAIKATPGIDVSTSGNATATLGYPISAGPRTSDDITSYSSRGPVPIAVLKPDIAAPGDNILAAMSPTAASGYTVANQAASSVIYGVESGTSMATPHITGSSILVRAIHPDWTPMQVKSALMTTATTVKVEDDSALANPVTAGAGRVDLTAATRASLLLDENKANFLAADPASGGKPETLNLASYYHYNCVGSCVFTRTVSSALSTSGTWAVAVSGLPAGSYSVDKTSFSLGAGAQTSYTLTIDSSVLPVGQWVYGQLTLTSTTDGTLPVQHLPIAIRAATAALHSDVTALTAHAAVGDSVTKVVNVSNAGNPTLDWSISTTTLKGNIVNQPLNTTTGYPDRTIVTSATSTAITSTSRNNDYSADYFDVWSTGTTLAEVTVHGFAYNSSTGLYPAVSTIATQLSMYVWADGTNAPNGRPGSTVAGDQTPIFQFPTAAGGLAPTATGVSYPGTAGTDDIIDIDLNTALPAAGRSNTSLTAGRYWLNVGPSIVSTSGTGATLQSTNYWYWGAATVAGKTPYGVLSIPNATAAASKAWNSVSPYGFAMQIAVNAKCSASWLSYSSTSGSLGLAGTAPVTLTFNATGLAPGTYKTYACLSGNGTSPANSFTSDADSLLIPVTFTVVAPPSSPTCSASPNPANISAAVTFTCSGADANTTNSIPGTTCTPNPTTNGSFSCSGTAGTIGATPILTTTSAAGDNAYVNLTLGLQVNVSAVVSGSGGVIQAPTSAAVNYAAPVSFTAVPDSGYSLASASGDTCTATVSGNVISVASNTTNCTITATFTPNPVDGVCGSDNGQTLLSAPSNLCSTGTPGTVTGTGPWAWTCGGAYGGATANCSASIQTWTVTASVSGTGGSVTSTNPLTVNNGSAASFTVSPSSGYTLGSATGCGASVSGNVITTAAVTANCSVVITFTAIPVNGICGSDNGQTLLAAPTNLCSAGSASAVAGSGPWSWTCNGANGGTTASCAASIKTWTVSASVSGSGGTIVSTNPLTVNNGSTASFTTSPSSGYSLASATGCGASVSGNVVTTAAVTANCSVTVTFSANPVDGVCGSDNSQTLIAAPTNLCSAGTASAVTGSGPWNWSCNGVNGGANADCSASIQTWTVTASVSGSGGSVSPASQSVNNGAAATVTATPDSGYTLTGVSATGCSASYTGNTISTGAVTANCALSATFTASSSGATLALSYGGTPIASGDTSPSVSDGTNFGSTVVGTPVLHTFTISNPALSPEAVTLIKKMVAMFVPSSSIQAAGDITITGISSGNTAFTVAGGTGILAQGSSTTFTVTFDPASTGTKTGTITISATNSDETSQTFTFSVTGFAAAAQAGPGGNVVATPLFDAKSLFAMIVALVLAGFIALRLRKRDL